MKLTWQQKRDMKVEYSTEWTTYGKLCKKYSVSRSTVRKVLIGVNKCIAPDLKRHMQRLEEAESICLPLPKETFREHPYHKKIYVSDMGRIVNRRGTYPHLLMLQIWKPIPYKCTMLTKNGQRVRCYVHTLVAETFLSVRSKERTKSGKRPLYTVSHLDNNPQNNHVDNLLWETLGDNLARSPKVIAHRQRLATLGFVKGVKGIKHPATKYGEEYMVKWKKMYRGGMSVNAIAREEGVMWLTVNRRVR